MSVVDGLEKENRLTTSKEANALIEELRKKNARVHGEQIPPISNPPKAGGSTSPQRFLSCPNDVALNGDPLLGVTTPDKVNGGGESALEPFSVRVRPPVARMSLEEDSQFQADLEKRRHLFCDHPPADFFNFDFAELEHMGGKCLMRLRIGCIRRNPSFAR